MFGADYAQMAVISSAYEDSGTDFGGKMPQIPELPDYMIPKYRAIHPWSNYTSSNTSTFTEDFILIAEFCEQEGPRPLVR